MLVDKDLAVTALGSDIQELLTYGVPEIGWRGDEDLSAVFNWAEDRWEIWRLFGTKHQKMIARSKGYRIDDFYLLLAHLRDHDLRSFRKEEILDRVNKHNERVAKSGDSEFEAEAEEKADKLRFGLVKDIGHLW